jgi:hypothetical protein
MTWLILPVEVWLSTGAVAISVSLPAMT